MDMKHYAVGAAYWVLLLCIGWGVVFQDAYIAAYATACFILFQQLMQQFFGEWLEEQTEMMQEEMENEDEEVTEDEEGDDKKDG